MEMVWFCEAGTKHLTGYTAGLGDQARVRECRTPVLKPFNSMFTIIKKTQKHFHIFGEGGKETMKIFVSSQWPLTAWVQNIYYIII